MPSPDEVAAAEPWEDLGDWSLLAGQWLAAGYDSEPLRRLASLDEHTSEQLPGSALRAVLRSVGVPLPEEGTFQARCHDALAKIQADLDRTGFQAARFRALAIDDDSFPLGRSVRPMFRVELIDVGWDHNVDVLDGLDGPTAMLRSAAAAVTDALLEIWAVAWPNCVTHSGPPLTARRADGDADSLWWYCQKGAHHVAPVGRLDADLVSAAPPAVSRSGSD